MLASPCVSQPNKQQKSKRPEILWSFIPIPQELFAYTGSIKQAGFMCSTFKTFCSLPRTLPVSITQLFF